MERYDTDDRWRERRWNLWVAHIGEMAYSIDVQLMNLGMESSEHLPGGATEIYRQVVRIDHIDSKPMRPQPRGDRLNIRWRGTELGAHLITREPSVKIGGAGIWSIYCVGPFLRGRTTQLKKHDPFGNCRLRGRDHWRCLPQDGCYRIAGANWPH
jgi:hypothetical protein